MFSVADYLALEEQQTRFESVAVLACWVPAQRASNVPPREVLAKE